MSNEQVEVLRFEIDGVSYEACPAMLDAQLSREYRKQTKMPWIADFAAMDDGDIAGLVALVWLARRQSGEEIPVSIVDQQIGTLGDLEELEIEFEDPADPGGDDPEASSADSD